MPTAQLGMHRDACPTVVCALASRCHALYLSPATMLDHRVWEVVYVMSGRRCSAGTYHDREAEVSAVCPAASRHARSSIIRGPSNRAMPWCVIGTDPADMTSTHARQSKAI
jgi:hypothetical protein